LSAFNPLYFFNDIFPLIAQPTTKDDVGIFSSLLRLTAISHYAPAVLFMFLFTLTFYNHHHHHRHCRSQHKLLCRGQKKARNLRNHREIKINSRNKSKNSSEHTPALSAGIVSLFAVTRNSALDYNFSTSPPPHRPRQSFAFFSIHPLKFTIKFTIIIILLITEFLSERKNFVPLSLLSPFLFAYWTRGEREKEIEWRGKKLPGRQLLYF
jgi:hypothetical protein